MAKSIIDIFIYVFEAFVLWYYCDNAFKSKYKRGIGILCILSVYAALYGVCQLRSNILNGVCTMLMIFLIIIFIYGERVISALTHTFLFYALLVASEYVTLPLIGIIFNNNITSGKNDEFFYLYAALFSKILHSIFVVILLVVYKKIKTKESIKGFALILVIPISNIIILAVFEYLSAKTPVSNEIYFLWVLVAALALLSSFLVFFNRSNIIRQSERINELNIENQKRKLDEQYFAVIEKANDDMRILAHDFKNHLMYIRELDNVVEKDNYIDKISPKISSFTNAGVSKNKTLDIIINKYSSLCELKNITFRVDVKTANLSQVDNVDLVSLFNNLLDNAFEAAEKSKNKVVELVIKEHTNYYDQIQILNSCDENPMQNGRLLTTKTNKSIHGIGLKSVRKIVKKYKGIYNWEYNNEKKEFITIISIPR